MTTDASRWVVPAVGFVIGIAVAAAELGRNGTPAQAALAFVIVAAYSITIGLLQSRSETLRVLAGRPVDERWEAINVRALSLAAQAIAVAILVAFLLASFGGSDPMPYAWLGLVFAAAYLGGLGWYRWRS